MKVSVYSEKRASGMYDEKGNILPEEEQDQEKGEGWFKGGERISYYQN